MSDPALERLARNSKFVDNEKQEFALINDLFAQKVDLNLQEDSPGRMNLVIDKAGQWIPYHDIAHPFDEIENKLSEKAPRDLLVCCGTGFGYHLMKILPMLQNVKKVILAEPNFAALFIFLTQLELSNFLDDRFKILYCPEDEILSKYIKKNLNRYNPTDLQMTNLDSINTLYPGYINKVSQKISESWNQHLVYLMSQQDQSAEILSHVIANIPRLSRSVQLKNDVAGESRIAIVGSGPSLEANINLLKKLQEFSYIMCVGSALHILLEHGIKPDWVVISDPQSVNKAHFPREGYDVDLIADIAISPEIISRFSRKISFINVGHSLATLLTKNFGVPTIENWGTVTTSALTIAEALGFREISLLGTEFSFVDQRIHAGDYQLEDSYEEDKVEVVFDVSGKKVLTTSIFQSYAKFTDDLVKKMKTRGCNVFNCCDGGLLFEPELISLRHLIFNYEKERNKRIEKDWYQKIKSDINLKTKTVERLTRLRTQAKNMLKDVPENNIEVKEIASVGLVAALEGLIWEPLKKLETAQLNNNVSDVRILCERISQIIDNTVDTMINDLE